MTTTVDIAYLKVQQVGDEYQAEYTYPVVVLSKDLANGKRVWAANCPLFKTVGYSTVDDQGALEDHQLDVEAFIKVHHKNGTLERALYNLGWSKISDDTFQSVPNIPVELLGNSHSAHQKLVFA